MKPYRLTFFDVSFAILLWAMMIAQYGYTYGSSDHEEILVYVQFLKNPSLYAHDFFIQCLNGSVPNERTVMAQILLPFAGHLGVAIFLFHFFNTVLVILAFIKIAGRFIESRYAVWVAIFFSFFVLYNKGLGGVDICSTAFQTGDLSAMVALWSILFFLDSQYILASVVISVATLIHVLVGFDLMVVLTIVMLWKYFISKEIKLRDVSAFLGIYLILAGFYLVLVYRAKASGNGTIADEDLFNIIFLFRHPHHFIFSTFPLYTKVLFLIYTSAAFLFYREKSYTAFQIVAVVTGGVALYIAAVDLAHLVFVASFQWYKNVIWVKFFGVAAIVGLIYQRFGTMSARVRNWINLAIMGGGLLSGSLVFYAYFHGDIAHGYKQYNEDEIKLSIKIKQITPIDAVFVQPFRFTAFKFYSQRSSYIDFKAIAKNKKDVKEWYERIHEVYGLNYAMKEKGFPLEEKADNYFNKLSETQISRLKSEGVTHMICNSESYAQDHKLILAENGYFVYEL